MSEKENITQKPKVGKDIFASAVESLGLQESTGFVPFIKFKKFGDYIIGRFVKIEEEEIKNKPMKQLYLEVLDSNITVINENTDNEETKENIKNLIVKFAMPTNVQVKLAQKQLVEVASIIGIRRLKESTFEKFGNKMIEYEVHTSED